MQQMISGRDFVVISSIEWSFLWQGPQEIASRLARAGNRVLYVENTGVRAPRVSDARRVASRIARWATASSNGLRSVESNLYVSSPLVFPPFGGPSRRQLNRRVFLSLVCRAAASLQMRDPIILTFLPTDTAVDLIQLLRTKASVVVYYCAADFAELASHRQQIVESERQLLGLSDLVLAQCSSLAAHCSRWSKNVHIMPYGVNLEAFVPQTKETRPTGIAADPPRPIIGYIGGLHKHLDLSLLTAMAEARPHWSWVCIGPAQTALGRLAALPNVQVRGEFQHAELAQQIERFDVGIVPYVNSAFTNTVVPTKVNEYLAMGKAVVSTALPSVCGYPGWRGLVVTAEPRPDSFIAAIEEALALPTDIAAKTQRREVAALSDWQVQLGRISDLLHGAIDARSNHHESLPLRKSAADGTT
jgi:glycosyltransferase involved in cell wall biosynthesis